VPKVVVLPRLLMIKPSKTLRALDRADAKLGYAKLKYRSHMIYNNSFEAQNSLSSILTYSVITQLKIYNFFTCKINPVKKIFMYLQFKVNARKI
jgi:hypothetical protein